MKKSAVYFFCVFCFLTVAKANPSAENKKLTLSLDEAILLAVRDNPNVQSSQLSYVAQKFSLWIQEWQFHPHYSFGAAALAQSHTNNQFHNNSQHYDLQPQASLLTPIGTQITLTANNTYTFNYNPGLSLQVMQPLIRGFGKAVVEASLNNARDSTVISRLNVEGLLRATVTDVINAYLSVVSAERTVLIDEEALQRAEKSVEQTKLFIKAGHKAGNELVTVSANAASAKAALENDKNSLIQSRYALLAAIGMDPNTDVHFTSLNVPKLIQKYHLPTLANAKKCVLENDIQYQTDLITLYGQRSRDVMIAEDNTRWQLNFIANATTGNGSGGGYNAGFNSIYNGFNHTQSAALTLLIPIDDQQAKQAVLNAKISFKQAQLALKQEKWNKETGAINSWNSVESAERALRYAEDAERLQEKTYNISYQKYLHGLIDSLELQSAQLSYIQAQQVSLSARINYLRSLVTLDQVTGHTLKTWKIYVRL